MNNNSSKQILLSVIGVAILVIAVVGVSFAFFSYVYNGEKANTVTTGQIVFSATDSQLTLTNVFPTDEAYITGPGQNDVVTAYVQVYGTTTYDQGIKYTVRATEVKNTSSKIYPRVIVTPVQQDGVTLATGYTAATTYDETNKLTSGMTIAQGTIAKDAKVGTGTDEAPVPANILSITAYYDKDDYHISDNTNAELAAAGLLAADYEANGGQIIKTAEWNALSANGPAYSFKIQVTAVEGDSADPRF